MWNQISQLAELNKQTASHVLSTYNVVVFWASSPALERAKYTWRSLFWLAEALRIAALSLVEKREGGAGATELRSAHPGRPHQSGSGWHRAGIGPAYRRWVVIAAAAVLSLALLAPASLITGNVCLPQFLSSTPCFCCCDALFDCNNRQQSRIFLLTFMNHWQKSYLSDTEQEMKSTINDQRFHLLDSKQTSTWVGWNKLNFSLKQKSSLLSHSH